MSHRVCPWWIGYLLASPIRNIVQNPDDILKPYVKNGSWVLDVGSAMGFFSLPMARMVGDAGHVVCVDLQERMIRTLRRRAVRKGLIGRMELRVCTPDTLNIQDLAEKFDFVLTFAVVHEVPDAQHLLSEVHLSLKRGGLLLLSEPTGHVSKDAFDRTRTITTALGFRIADSPRIRQSSALLLVKN